MLLLFTINYKYIFIHIYLLGNRGGRVGSEKKAGGRGERLVGGSKTVHRSS